MKYYRAFSLNIYSEIEFPELAAGFPDMPIDLQISVGKTPDKLEGSDVLTRVRNQSRPGQFLINIHNIGRIYVENGNTILVDYKKEADRSFLKNYILTRAISAALHQRHWTPIHASSIALNDKAILFAGHSGSGKSTTTSAFVKRGYPFISDDICIIKKEADNLYKVHHSYPQIRLWDDALEMIADPKHNKDNPIGNKINKFSVKPSGDIISEPLEISHIYILRTGPVDSETLISMDGLEKLQELQSLTFAKSQLKGMGGIKEQFETMSYLIKNCAIKILNQPIVNRDIWRTIDFLEQDFNPKLVS